MQSQQAMQKVLEDWLISKPSLVINEYNMGKLVAYFDGKNHQELTTAMLDEAERNIPDLIYFGRPQPSAPEAPPKLFQQESDGRLTHSAREAQRLGQREEVAKAANDITGPIWQAKNSRDKAEYDRLIKDGPITTTPGGRYDAARTEKRRAELLAIKPIYAKQRAADGSSVIIYELMVGKIKEQLHHWETKEVQWGQT